MLRWAQASSESVDSTQQKVPETQACQRVFLGKLESGVITLLWDSQSKGETPKIKQRETQALESMREKMWLYSGV